VVHQLSLGHRPGHGVHPWEIVEWIIEDKNRLLLRGRTDFTAAVRKTRRSKA
jgi:hypothetical protein